MVHRPIGVGYVGIGVGESASGTAVGKRDAVTGNGIAVLVGHKHGEALVQLRSSISELIIAAGDGDFGCGSGNGVLSEGDVPEAGGTAGDRNR